MNGAIQQVLGIQDQDDLIVDTIPAQKYVNFAQIKAS